MALPCGSGTARLAGIRREVISDCGLSTFVNAAGAGRLEGKELDYRNSKEGRAAAARYSDIIGRSRPEPSYLHPRMPVSARAKIFSPFAALRGYDEELAEEEQKKSLVPKKALTEEKSRILSERLTQVRKGMTVTVRYFAEDTLHPATPPLGTYEDLSGMVVWMDPAIRQLCIRKDGAEIVIGFDEMDGITGGTEQIEGACLEHKTLYKRC